MVEPESYNEARILGKGVIIISTQQCGAAAKNKQQACLHLTKNFQDVFYASIERPILLDNESILVV